jgi:hypothetical protein
MDKDETNSTASCPRFMWTETCNRLDTGKSKYLLGRKELSPVKNAPPCLTWLLDNGSTCHIADEREVLPFCFNVRTESTVIKAVKDTSVATSRRRADLAISFNVKTPNGPKSAVVLLADIQ